VIKIFVLVGDKQVAKWMSCIQISNQRVVKLIYIRVQNY